MCCVDWCDVEGCAWFNMQFQRSDGALPCCTGEPVQIHDAITIALHGNAQLLLHPSR